MLRTETEKQNTVIYLEGVVNAKNAEEISKDLKAILPDAEGRLIIDAEGLEYISSAGLRVLLSVSKILKYRLTIRNVSLEVYEIFENTGFTQLMDVRKKMRRISIEGCEMIGKGACGTVYRIDDETVVKVYDSPDKLPLIEVEQERAKQAFICGLPTAISYNIVRVGESYGSVFELVNAQSLNEFLKTNVQCTDQIIRDYVALIRQIHSVRVTTDRLPQARDIYLTFVDELRDTLPEDVSSGLRRLLKQMHKGTHLVHGDIQMKNVLIEDGRMIIIDMETLSAGNPVFDLQAIYVVYRAYNETEPDNSEKFLGISGERSAYIWERILSYYFEGYTPEQIREFEKRIRILAYLRLLYIVVINGATIPELKETRIKYSVDMIRELLGEVDTLEIS